MKMKRILSLILSVTLLCGILCPAVFADEATVQKTFRYVALGDSITAGFGLGDPDANVVAAVQSDRTMILTQEKINDPIAQAYPAVFGEMLGELGDRANVEVSAVNLAVSGYRAVDVEQVILQDGYVSPSAMRMYEVLTGTDAPASLADYHDLYMKYLPDADLISIQLGSNEILAGLLTPLYEDENPIVMAAVKAILMYAAGADRDLAVAEGMKIIEEHKDAVTEETYAQAAAYFASLHIDPEALIDLAAEDLEKAVEAVRQVNSSADVALLNMYNPYGNSAEYDGQVRDLITIITNIFSGAAVVLTDSDLFENLPTEFDAADLFNDLKDRIGTGEILNYYEQYRAQKLSALLTLVSDEVAYPLQYALLGRNIAPYIVTLNEKIEAIAEETGAVYVDIYHVGNELNIDPHPDAQTHRQIAGYLFDAVSPTVRERMGISDDDSFLLGDADGDDDVTVLDATAIQRHVADLPTARFIEEAADADEDHDVTVLDATAVQRYVADLPTHPGIGERRRG